MTESIILIGVIGLFRSSRPTRWCAPCFGSMCAFRSRGMSSIRSRRRRSCAGEGAWARWSARCDQRQPL